MCGRVVLSTDEATRRFLRECRLKRALASFEREKRLEAERLQWIAWQQQLALTERALNSITIKLSSPSYDSANANPCRMTDVQPQREQFTSQDRLTSYASQVTPLNIVAGLLLFLLLLALVVFAPRLVLLLPVLPLLAVAVLAVAAVCFEVCR